MLLICVVWGTIFTDLAGQSNLHSETRYRRRLDEARKYFNSFKYDETEKVLTRLIQKFPDRVPAWILLGQMAGEQHRTQLMDSAYSQVLNLDSTDYPEAYYQVALIRYRQGMYREASRVLARYERNRIKKDTEAKEFVLLRHRILFALDQISRDSILTFPVAVSGINTPSDEYHPSLSIDGRRLVFTRQKQNSSGIMTEDLYESQRNSKGWTHPVRLPEPINSNGNEGAQTMRQDGRELIFTACNRPDTKGSCDLYFSVRKGNQWSFPKNLGYPVNTRYWESTPALTPDGRFLVFSSNRPGGMGGMDLWIAENLGANNWSEPKNLGPHINTNGDEVSPFIYYDSNKLFFSSNGWVGMGGFDLFTISFSGSSVSGDPVNLGYPVNTHADETGLTLAGLPGPAIISSNRTPGKGR
ncbi:MAG: PD40 domain-containing protein, partial [Bacteroidales bacterium]|nr:PD40 domain-containing protein [Bacteroidales bacterium]